MLANKIARFRQNVFCRQCCQAYESQGLYNGTYQSSFIFSEDSFAQGSFFSRLFLSGVQNKSLCHYQAGDLLDYQSLAMGGTFDLIFTEKSFSLNVTKNLAQPIIFCILKEMKSLNSSEIGLVCAYTPCISVSRYGHLHATLFSTSRNSIEINKCSLAFFGLT